MSVRQERLARALYEYPWLRESLNNMGAGGASNVPWANLGEWAKEELRSAAHDLLAAANGTNTGPWA